MVFNIVSKFQKGLAKTKSGLVDSITRAVNKARGIDQDLLAELEEILILGDVGVQTAENVIDDLREKSLTNGYSTAETIIAFLKQHLARELVNAPVASGTVLPRPYVISIVGVNGTGKTTTIGKLGHRLQSQGKKVLVAAADTFRAAAIDQLDIWATRAHVDIIHTQPGADPASVAFDAIKAATARNVDYLLIDTAGRLHTKSNLMAELEKIHRVVGRQIPGAPHEVLLVLDATTGQNGLAQAKKFASSVKVTGIVLTKLDGTAKGGIVFSIKKELNIPVRYIGVGEQLDDLEEFDPHAFIEALFH